MDIDRLSEAILNSYEFDSENCYYFEDYKNQFFNEDSDERKIADCIIENEPKSRVELYYKILSSQLKNELYELPAVLDYIKRHGDRMKTISKEGIEILYECMDYYM